MPGAFVNYYELLKVDPSASASEIGEAFRRDIKKYHPDRNRSRKTWAEEKTRLLIEAREELSTDSRRRQYDRRLADELGERYDSYARRLTRDISNPRSLARLILHHLLNENQLEAVRIYEQALRESGSSEILQTLGPKDRADCAFLLGEEYERLHDYRRAVSLYETARSQTGYRPLRYFADEIKERIFNISCRKLAKECDPREAISCYRRLFDLDLSRRRQAHLYKRIAEVYLAMGERESADRELRKALELDPNIKGKLKLSRGLRAAGAKKR